MDFSTFHYLVFSLGVFGGLFLSAWVYFSGKKEAINKLFSSMVLLWIIGEMVPYFIFRNIAVPKEIIFFLPKLEIFFVFIFFIFFYFFSVKFLKEEKKFRLLSKIIVGVSLIGAFLAIFTNIFQKEVILTEGMKGLDLVLSPEGKIFWLGFVIIMTIFIFSRFVINYFKSEKKDKLRIQYFILGILSWIIINLVFNVYFPLVKDTFKYAILGNYSILILFGFTAYAIIKRDLFGIKIVLTQTLVGIIAILLLVDVVVSKTLFEYVWKGILFGLFVVLGWLLIRSVLKEIKYREEIKEAYKREVEYRKKVKEAYEIEKQAHTELQRLDEAKTQFIMATQHHLRTPLTSMIGYLDLIFGGIYGKVPLRLGATLKKLEVSTNRLIKIVNELLDISQFQLGKKIVILKPGIEIEPILREIMEELETETKTKKIYLKLIKSKKVLPLIKADPEKLKVAITNIIDNGVKYTNKGGVTIYLKTQNANVKSGEQNANVKSKRKLQIVVKDTGMGIAKGELKALFSKTFERGEKAKQIYTTGRGIGLYITYQIIQAHNGKIWAESEGKNKGTSFYIELPVD